MIVGVRCRFFQRPPPTRIHCNGSVNNFWSGLIRCSWPFSVTANFIFDLYCAPTDFVTRCLDGDGHAWLHGNVSCVGQERIVDFFCWPNQEWELSRFQTYGVTEEKVRVVGNPRRAHALNHGFVEILRPRSGFQSLYRLQYACLNGIIALAMFNRWLRTHAARFAHMRKI